MRNRLPLALSFAALVVAVFGGTPLGGAAVSMVYDAQNAHKVDGRHAVGAATTDAQRAGRLVAANANGNFPLGAMPAGVLSGAQVVTRMSPQANNAPSKGTTVRCPSGKVALGGGYTLSGGNLEDVTVRINAPANAGDDPPFGWTVQADKVNVGGADDWMLGGWVVCARSAP